MAKVAAGDSVCTFLLQGCRGEQWCSENVNIEVSFILHPLVRSEGQAGGNELLSLAPFCC